MVLEKNPKTRHLVKKLLEAEDHIKGKPFPSMLRVRQVTKSTCGPATLEMLFSFVGGKVSQKNLIKLGGLARKIDLYGLNINDMAKAANAFGKKKYTFWRKQSSTLSDLDKVVNKFHFPVGVEWQGVFYENEDEDSGHYGVVTKVDKKTDSMRIADPFFNGYFNFKGTDRKFKLTEFKKRWWDVNEIKVAGSKKTRTIKDVRVMFIITPKGDVWPEKLGMVKI